MLIKLQFWKWIKSTLETQYLCVSPLEPPTKVKSEHHEAITKFWCRNEPPDSTIIQTGGFLSIPVCSQFKQDEITLENHRRLRNPACPAYWELFHNSLWLQTGLLLQSHQWHYGKDAWRVICLMQENVQSIGKKWRMAILGTVSVYLLNYLC